MNIAGRLGAVGVFVAAAGISGFVGAEPIDIQPGVFVALERPGGGYGPASGSKHITWAYNPVNQRLYSIGGDFTSGDSNPDSYRQDQYSVSISERWANRSDRNAGWRQEYPYCGPDGGVQPKSPDFVGWTWDSIRQVYWFVPGTVVVPVYAICSDRTVSTSSDAKYKYRHLMTFDPFEPDLTKRWRDYGPDASPYRGENWMSVHDPVTDTIIRFGLNQAVDIYDVQSDSWTELNTGTNALGRTTRVYDDMLSPDFENRVIYAVDGTVGRLMRWDIDARRMDDLGAVPDGPVTPEANGYSVWDSVNKVLLFFHMNTRRIHVYHPDTDTWESPPVVTEPSGLSPYVRHGMVFDPSNNVLVMLGNNDPSNPYIYLYRYQEGAVPSDPSPAAPSNLQAD
jgi:hypothetical protein